MPFVTVTPRQIHLEDLSVTTSPTPTPSSQYVGGVGTTNLTPISVVLYSAFIQASDDTAAAAAGVNLGFIYYNTTSSALKARLT